MGWFRYSSSVKFRRAALITVDNSAGAAATSLDVDVTIPKDWEDFWGVIDSSGNNLRVTGPDGVTAVAYDVDDGAGGAFSTTTRAGRIRIDGMTIPTSTAGIFALWVYFDPDGSVTDGSSVVTMSSIGTGYIEVGKPHGPWMFEFEPQVPRSTNPKHVSSKAPDEQIQVWINLTKALEKHHKPSQGSRERESVYYSTMAVLNTSAADQTSMYALGSNRFYFDWRTNTTWLKCLVKAGTTDTRYTVAPKVHTVVPFAPTTIYQTLTPRLGLPVRTTIFES